MTTNKTSYYCSQSQKYFNHISKDEFFSHKEQCLIKNDPDQFTSTPNIIASFTFGGKYSDGLKEMVHDNSVNQSFKGRK